MDLTADTLLHWAPRGSYHDALNHVVIHGLDAMVPLGDRRYPPAETLQIVLHDRNVVGHLPKEHGRSVDRRLATIFADPDADRGLSAARRLAQELQADQPDAAASLREGLEDMFTVRRLGITGALPRTLTNTNCIESMISVARRTTGRVTRWKDGSMTKLWIAAGMLQAERSLRDCKDMTKLVDAPRRQLNPSADNASQYDQEAA